MFARAGQSRGPGAGDDSWQRLLFRFVVFRAIRNDQLTDIFKPLFCSATRDGGKMGRARTSSVKPLLFPRVVLVVFSLRVLRVVFCSGVPG